MYMNGRGPMGRGFGPMGRPMHYHRPMGYRPMGIWHRPMGLFPIGGLFILPALMFGGWIAIAAVGGILSLAGTVLGSIFSGLSSLASGAFSGGGLALGVVAGVLAFYYFRNRKSEAAQKKNAGTADHTESEIPITDPAEYRYTRTGE